MPQASAGGGMNPFSIASLGLGVIGGIGKLFARGKANRDLRTLQGQDPTYVENPLAKSRLGLATTLLNARMPGAATEEKNIYGNQASTISNINRVATSSNEALLGAAGVQGQTNEAFNKLGLQEDADYQRRYGNYTGAQEGVINEQDKVFNDNVRRFQDKAQIQGQINDNRQSGWDEISNLGFGLGDFGMSGGFNNMFGSRQGRNSGGGGGWQPPRNGFNSAGYATGI